MKNIFVVCQHGDEDTPLKVINENFAEKVDFIIANPNALLKRKRFIDKDLNRSFPGKDVGLKEDKIAKELTYSLKKYDIVLDFHTTSTSSEIFIITTSLSSDHVKLINKLNIKKVVFMANSIASGNSLIDHVKLGVSIEVGKGGSEYAYESIKKMISDYLEDKVDQTEKEYYAVLGVIKKENLREKLAKSIKPFVEVHKGEVISKVGKKERFSDKTFFPIMPGEKSYEDTLTIIAKKLSKKELSARIGEEL